MIHRAAIVYQNQIHPKVYDVNVGGTNIAEKTLERNAKLVYVSSVHAIEEKPNGETITETKKFDPDKVLGQYAKTKAEAAKYILEASEKNGLNVCIVHPSGMIGPNDFSSGHTTQLMVDFIGGRLTACVRGGYDFADVRDVADGIISACEKGNRGECYILSTDMWKSKSCLICGEVRNIKKIKTVLLLCLQRLGCSGGNVLAILKQPPLYTRYSLYTLTSNSNFSNRKQDRNWDTPTET